MTIPCCPGTGTSAHVRGCVNHPEYVSPFFEGLTYGDKPLEDPQVASSEVMGADVARFSTRDFDCMFHDEGIPDAPCICGPERLAERGGSHEIVQGSVVSDRIDHRPQRTDQVEAWLKAKRDGFNKEDAYGRGLWHVMDSILDEYRLAADMGLTLEEVLKYDGPR